MSSLILDALGPEIYDGEISDRMLSLIKWVTEVGDKHGWDKRSLSIFKNILKYSKASDNLYHLIESINNCTKDKKKVSKCLPRILESHGYVKKSDKKHIRMSSKKGYEGLEPITISKTPSEYRGLKNLEKQVERAMGLTRLKKI